jgi:hypothetical protein
LAHDRKIKRKLLLDFGETYTMEKSYTHNRTRAHRIKRRRLLFIIIICIVLKLSDIFSSKPQPVKTIEFAEKIKTVSTDKLNNESKGSES